jgi:DNA (cytosine-5)-methyltransferase 1
MKVLDLFSGIGGFSLGLERAGMETIAFCEIEKYCQKVLKKHWPEVPIYEDIKQLDGTKYRGAVDVVCGGFPCQDLSVAGNQEGFEGERSSLYREMLRIISECLPRYAIFENVTGLISGDGGRWFARFLYDLAAIGYDAEWNCISASYIGAPHHRDRVWIVAYPNRKRCERKPKITHYLQQQIELMRSDTGKRKRFDLSEPALCRKDDGISNRSHRLKALGNAVVPQIPEAIGLAIMEVEQINNTD